MSIEATRKFVLSVLSMYKGDDTARAEAAFKGLSDEQMQQPYGTNGKTKAEILADYQRRDSLINDAIEWVRQAK